MYWNTGRAVAFADSVSQRRPAISPASHTLLYPGPIPPDSDNTSAPSLTPFDLAPARTSCKRPRASQFTVNVPPYAQTLNDDHDDILNLKKAKTNGPRSDLYTSGRHSGVGITDIDDVADARDEFLNKTDPTVDIKAFFKTLPHVPGRPKSHMSCNLCA